MRPMLLALCAGLATLVPQDDGPPEPRGPEIGKPAPTVRLNDHTGTATSLGGESKTWTVLAFFPKAATPG